MLVEPQTISIAEAIRNLNDHRMAPNGSIITDMRLGSSIRGFILLLENYGIGEGNRVCVGEILGSRVEHDGG